MHVSSYITISFGYIRGKLSWFLLKFIMSDLILAKFNWKMRTGTYVQIYICMYTYAILFFLSSAFFSITAAAPYYSTSYPLAYFICIILRKYISHYCVMHLKRFPRKRILSHDGSWMTPISWERSSRFQTHPVGHTAWVCFIKYKLYEMSNIILHIEL